MENGFLREVLKGWYITVPQDERPGDSTSWYISFWSFCARYLKDRFGRIPEQSGLYWTIKAHPNQ